MSWFDALDEAGEAFEEEFGTDAIVVPMIARPNRRSEPDPRRQPFRLCGVFHEANKLMGDGRKNTDGLSETWLSSLKCTFSAPRSAFVHPPTQGDAITICQLGREFRVLDVEREMATRTRLVLEEIEPDHR